MLALKLPRDRTRPMLARRTGARRLAATIATNAAGLASVARDKIVSGADRVSLTKMERFLGVGTS